jgi:outer membrane protein assembly factor BamB
MKRILLALGLLVACGPPERIVVIHPKGSDGPRRMFRVIMTQRITLPDNFILRPDEFAAVTVDHPRNTIYTGSREGTLLALDHDSGEVLWEEQLGGAVSGQATLADLPAKDEAPAGLDEPLGQPRDLLLVGTDNGELVAIDLRTRKTAWRYQTDGKIRNPPISFQGVVYLVNTRDQVFALDLRTGAWRWQYEQELQTDFTVVGRAGLAFVPPAPGTEDVGTLYTGFDNGKVVAIGAASGEALWIQSVAPPEGGDFVDCDSTPLVDAGRGELVVAGQSTGVFTLAMVDGAVRWQRAMKAVGTIVSDGGTDLVGASSLEGVFALDREGDMLWRTQVDPGVVSTPVVVDETVYVTHSESGLLAFDRDTGEFLAQIDPGSGMSSVPVFDPEAGRFYATTNRGLLISLQIEQEKEHPLLEDPQRPLLGGE